MATPGIERSQARPNESGDPRVETPRRLDDAADRARESIRPEDMERARAMWVEKQRASDGEPYYACKVSDGTAYVVSRNQDGVPALFLQKPGQGFAEVPNWFSRLSSEGVDRALIVSVQENIARLTPATERQPSSQRREAAPERPQRAQWQEKQRASDGEPYYAIKAPSGVAYVVSRNREGVPMLFRQKPGQSFKEMPNWNSQLASEGISRAFLDSAQEKLNTLASASVETVEQPAEQQREEAPEAERPATQEREASPERPQRAEWQQKQRASDGEPYYAIKAPSGVAYVVSRNREGVPMLFRQKPGQSFKEMPNWNSQLASEGISRAFLDSAQEKIDSFASQEKNNDFQRAEEAFRSIEAISVLNGKQIEFTGSSTEVINGRKVLSRNYFRKRNIVPDRMDDFVRHVENSARMLDEYVRHRSENWQSENWEVYFDGTECFVKAPRYQGRAIATPRGVMREDITGRLQTAEGMPVNRQIRGNEVDMRLETWGADGERVRYRPGHGIMSSEVYDGRGTLRVEYYDGGTDRPTMVRSLRSHTLTLPAQSGSRTMANYTLEAGKVYTFGEQGPPHTDYASETGDRTPATREGSEMESQKERIREYAERLGQDLGSPEAIARYISNHVALSEESRQNQDAAPTFKWTGDGGVQDVRHPLESLFFGKGDCEDQALVAQYLLKVIGIDSVVTPMTSSHYECVYVEEVSTPEGSRYRFCTLDGLYGFTRSKQGPFKTPGEAMRASFSGARHGISCSAKLDLDLAQERLPSGKTRYEQGIAEIEAKISTARSRGEPTQALTLQKQKLVNYYTRLQDAVNNSGSSSMKGGASILHPPSFEKSMLSRGSTPGRSDVRRHDDNEYWAQFIRFSESERDWSRPEVATRDPRIETEIARLEEARDSGKVNEWMELSKGAPEFMYFMDDQGHLFASKTPSDASKGYHLLNVVNEYRWEHQSYS